MKERDPLLEPMLTVDWSGQSMLATGAAPVAGIETSGIMGRLLGHFQDPSVSLRDESAFLVSGLEGFQFGSWEGQDAAYWDFAAHAPEAVALRLKSPNDPADAWTTSARPSRYRGSAPSQQPSTARKSGPRASFVAGPESIPGAQDRPAGLADRPSATPEVIRQQPGVTGTSPRRTPLSAGAPLDAPLTPSGASAQRASTPLVARPPRRIPGGRGPLLTAERPLWSGATPDRAPAPGQPIAPFASVREPAEASIGASRVPTSAARPGSTPLSPGLARKPSQSLHPLGQPQSPGQHLSAARQPPWSTPPSRPSGQAQWPGQTVDSGSRALSLPDDVVAAMGPALGRVATVAGWFDTATGRTHPRHVMSSGDTTLPLVEFSTATLGSAEPGASAGPRTDATRPVGRGAGKHPAATDPSVARHSSPPGTSRTAADSATGSDRFISRPVYPEASARPAAASNLVDQVHPGISRGDQPHAIEIGTGSIRPRRPSAAGSLTQSVAVHALRIGRVSGSVPGHGGPDQPGSRLAGPAFAMSELPVSFHGMSLDATEAPTGPTGSTLSSIASFLPGVASEPSLLLLAGRRTGPERDAGTAPGRKHAAGGAARPSPGVPVAEASERRLAATAPQRSTRTPDPKVSGKSMPPVAGARGSTSGRSSGQPGPSHPFIAAGQSATATGAGSRTRGHQAPSAWALRAEDLLAPLGSSIPALLEEPRLASTPAVQPWLPPEAAEGARHPLDAPLYGRIGVPGHLARIIHHGSAATASTGPSRYAGGTPTPPTARGQQPVGATRPDRTWMPGTRAAFVPMSMGGPHLEVPGATGSLGSPEVPGSTGSRGVAQDQFPGYVALDDLGFVAPNLARILANLPVQDGTLLPRDAPSLRLESQDEPALVAPGDHHSPLGRPGTAARRLRLDRNASTTAARGGGEGPTRTDRASMRPGRGTRQAPLPGIPEAPSTVSLSLPVPGSRSPESLWGTTPMASVHGAPAIASTPTFQQPGGGFPLVAPALAAVSATASLSRTQDGPPASARQRPEDVSRSGHSAGGPTVDMDALAEEMASRILRRIKRDKERRGING